MASALSYVSIASLYERLPNSLFASAFWVLDCASNSWLECKVVLLLRKAAWAETNSLFLWRKFHNFMLSVLIFGLILILSRLSLELLCSCRHVVMSDKRLWCWCQLDQEDGRAGRCGTGSASGAESIDIPHQINRFIWNFCLEDFNCISHLTTH